MAGKDNSVEVLFSLIKALDIPVTRQSIDDELQRHPEKNSLLAFSDLLNNWNVPNAAYKLAFEQLANVPLPFIAYFSRKRFVTVTQLDDEHAIISNEQLVDKTISNEEFKKSYSGSVLVAEKSANSGEKDYAKKHRKEIVAALRMPVVLTGFVILLVVFLLTHSTYITSFNLQTVLLMLLKTTGLAVSVLLLIQSIDANNPLVQKLCGSDSNKNCNAILSSKAARITEELSWSEVGFFYFAGTWLVLLFANGQTNIMHVLALLNLIGLPYTFYSIWYQWRVAKQWCVFCCAIQILLWLEFFAFFPNHLHSVQLPTVMGWCSLFTAMTMPVLCWILAKPYLLESKQMTPLKQQLRKFKYNIELFQSMLNAQIKYATPADENSLIIGNRDAEHIITMVSNPYCQPCAKTHKALDEWLINRDDIKLQVIFFTSNNGKNKKTVVAKHLLSIQNSQNDIALKKALNDWYQQKKKSYANWAWQYPISGNEKTLQILQVQREWCKMAEIIFTPTIFFNGRRIPKYYGPEDLKYLL